ncbi:GyrI-like domain-containing protein [Bacteroidota bacterium]
MEFEISKPKNIILAGMSFYGDPFRSSSEWTEENEIGRLFNRLMTYYYENGEKIKPLLKQESLFEIHIQNNETNKKGLFEVFVGFELNELCAIPIELLIKTLPNTKYAKSTILGKDINMDYYQKIYMNLIEKGYEVSHQYNIQYYDHRFKGMDKLEESEFDLLIPVK